MAKHGRYKITRRVADGGMAEIFLATQLGREGFQKPVVLKRIHSAIYADPQFRNMFLDEAHISMSLSHSNIVQVLDLGVSAGRYFLVLELVDGWDLGRILYRSATAAIPLPHELALYVTTEVCRALAYAHSKSDGSRPLGIVHRDVSPHNVLVSDQGEVKLTDFGIAKAMNKREHTGTGVVKGKVAFMSPEQALGKPIDARSDLFSLGTVLYLLLTGTRPFDGPSELETLLRVQKGDFSPLEEVAPDLPTEVAEVVARAMRFNADERYQTADDMLTDLEHVLRTAFRPVGQTELKRWLAELSTADGVPPISQSTARATPSRTGTGELEEQDVVLLDTNAEEVDGEEATSLAVLKAAGGRPSISRARSAPMLPVPDDAESMANQSGRLQLALPVPEVEERPGRRRVRRRSGGPILLVGALLVAGAWVGGKYARLWSDGGNGNGTPAAGAHDQAAGAHAQALTGKNRDKLEVDREEARKATGPAARAAAAADAEAKADEANVAARRAEPQASREPNVRRTRSSDRQRDRDYLRRDISGLKMAPDPSLLPAAPASDDPPATAPAPAPPVAPAAAPETP